MLGTHLNTVGINNMKLYICGPDNGGDGSYDLVSETGEVLANHYCSSIGFARGDLEAGRPERQKEWKERFGDYEVVVFGDDDMTKEELQKRNKEWFEKTKDVDKDLEGKTSKVEIEVTN